MRVKQCHLHHPPVITIFVGGTVIFINHSRMGVLWHCFTQIVVIILILVDDLVCASGWKTARVVVHIFPIGHWVAWGGILTFIVLAYSRDLAMPLCRVITGWVGWGGILTFIVLAYSRDLAMPLCRVITGWVGWGGILTFIVLAYSRDLAMPLCRVITGWVGWGGILTFIVLAYSRDLAMPLCRVITGWVGWGGILTFIVLAYSRDLAMPLCRVITGWVGWGGILTFIVRAYSRDLWNVEDFQRCYLRFLDQTQKKPCEPTNAFKAFEYGNGGGTMQIKIFSVSLAML